NNRRYFDLIERLLPAELLGAPNPHTSLDHYHDWHVLRRVGSLGIASTRGSDHWLGMHGLRLKNQRQVVIERLLARGALRQIKIPGLNADLLICSADLALLAQARQPDPNPPAAAFIAALDNLMWDRALIAHLFDFEYTWEVYKPAAQRQYGYYVLPVLYGDRFVARCEPRFEKNSRILRLDGWWWQPGITPDEDLEQALQAALLAFASYLGTEKLEIAASLEAAGQLDWIRAVQAELAARSPAANAAGTSRMDMAARKVR
ncbi:MAG: winged helix DNA-binding domain-containing protein, partial [Anaerolineales bacterium]|nr:winged helix DNA-binding domain-containing protein [Anaerolineales bacterium]